MSGPSISYGFTGPKFIQRDTVYISSKTKIYLKITDSESGINKIEYAVDNGEDRLFEEPFSLEKEGPHDIKITGYDNVENSSILNLRIIVDKTGPEIYSRFSILPAGKKNINGKILDVYPNHVVLFLSSTDNVVGFNEMYYSINDAPEIKYAGLIRTFSPKGNYNVKIRAQDKLGNETSEKIDFVIGD